MTDPTSDESPYVIDEFRSLIRHKMPQGYWIIWNWLTAKGDEKSEEDIIQIRRLP